MPTEVLSLAGFYTLFYEEPVGKYVLEICTDLPCALKGAEEFTEMACRKLGIDVDGTTEDGMFTVKKVMCLAACDKAPMLQVNLKYEENLDEEKFDALISRLRQEAADGQAHYYGVEALKNSLEAGITMAHILLRHRDVENIHQYDVYVTPMAAMMGLKKALQELSPDDVRDIVKKANIRGRAWSGFSGRDKVGIYSEDGRPQVCGCQLPTNLKPAPSKTASF